ncbi:MAG: mucin desulfatase [Clostridiales bacterium GWF2_38_85]|nr:MAG: mucin desulfatase [Clostridiales bacterium GWF2_38_85]HBL83597.1 mucin desulfatase [Clostridiales bacterium]
MADLLRIANEFDINGTAISAESYGFGHINDTYIVVTDTGVRYILQRVNNNVFKNVEQLMGNIESVTSFLRKGINCSCECLTLVLRKNGKSFLKEDDKYYRVYNFIEDAVTYQTVSEPVHFYYSGVAFGRFQRQLAEFPAEALFEVIPNFHNTKSRYADFEKAVEQDVCNRAASVKAEIEFAKARKSDASVLVDMLEKGELPLRVTHNDTKLNNVMLDIKTGTPKCVIDLDTVMPGLLLYDFGDSMRFGTNPAAEDEKDISKVYCDLNLFEQYSRGFLEECGDMLTENEIKMLPFSAKIMTYECGIRFLTDHLNGDTYFKIHRGNHNLDRCRTQFKLVADMEQKMDKMNDIIKNIINK